MTDNIARPAPTSGIWRRLWRFIQACEMSSAEYQDLRIDALERRVADHRRRCKSARRPLRWRFRKIRETHGASRARSMTAARRRPRTPGRLGGAPTSQARRPAPGAERQFLFEARHDQGLQRDQAAARTGMFMALFVPSLVFAIASERHLMDLSKHRAHRRRPQISSICPDRSFSPDRRRTRQQPRAQRRSVRLRRANSRQCSPASRRSPFSASISKESFGDFVEFQAVARVPEKNDEVLRALYRVDLDRPVCSKLYQSLRRSVRPMPVRPLTPPPGKNWEMGRAATAGSVSRTGGKSYTSPANRPASPRENERGEGH